MARSNKRSGGNNANGSYQGWENSPSDNRSADASRYSRSQYGSGQRQQAQQQAAGQQQRRAAAQGQQRRAQAAAQQGQQVQQGQQARMAQQRRAQQGQARQQMPQGARPAQQGQPMRNGAPAGANPYSRDAAQYTKRKKHGVLKGVIIAVILVAIIGVAGYFLIHALYIDQINKQLQGNKSEAELQAIDDALADYSDETFSEPFYAMLIGSDERVDDEGMGARSDTNIVIRIDAVNKQITMVSIPRDTMVTLDGYGTQKFNAAYQFGGAALTISEATKITGAPISHYASVNFDGLTALVDAVGGVDVQVDERIEDEDAGNVVIEAGLQHLDGEAALVFARSRAYTDGDFSRVANQRKLIAAIIDKVMTLPAAEMVNVISAASQCGTTDMNVHSIQALAQQLRAGDSTPTIYSATIPSSSQYIDGVSYVVHDQTATDEMMAIVDQGGDPSTVGNLSTVEQEGLENSAS